MAAGTKTCLPFKFQDLFHSAARPECCNLKCTWSTLQAIYPVLILLLCLADVDEQSKKEIKDILLAYDRTLLVADPRRCEPKK